MHNFLFSGKEVIVFIQSFASPWWDSFFAVMTGLGEEAFFFVLFPVLYWLVSKKVGIRAFVIFLIVAILNFDLKEFFKMPRPFFSEIYDPRIKIYQLIKNHAFPSGHALLSTVLWGYLAAHLKKIWFWILALIIILLVSLSRIYFGFHFPQDVIAGILLGILFLAIALLSEEKILKIINPLHFNLKIILAILLPVGFSLIHFDAETFKVGNVLGGALIGRCLEDRFIRFEIKNKPRNMLLRLLIGGACIFVLKYLSSLAPLNWWVLGAVYFSLGLGVTLIGPFLFKHFNC